jgi:serine/threonine protein kinase
MGVHTDPHPSREVLRAYSQGKLDDAAALDVMSHLEICQACSKQATSLSNDDFEPKLPAGTPPSEPPAKTPYSTAVPTPPWVDEVARPPQGTTLGPPPAAPPRPRRDSAKPAPAAPHSTVNPAAAADQDTGLRGAAPGSGADLSGIFGHYRIVRKLGQGGMGAVYLAMDTSLNRQVAIKVPCSNDASYLKRLKEEALAAASLQHPNICPIHEFNSVSGTHYLCMPFIEGKDLAAYIDPNRPQPERQIAILTRKLAKALQAAHEKGVIHRDLKPANIMMNKSKDPIIMDFGLARMLDRSGTRLTAQGEIMGTPAYMSPEQVRGDLHITHSTDIYTLGVILYELLTGRLPFEGPVHAVLVQITMHEPNPPSRFRPDLDPRLESICLKAMAKKPENRYASMKDFALALETYLRAVPATAKDAKPAGASGEVKPQKPTPVSDILEVQPVRPEPQAAEARVDSASGDWVVEVEPAAQPAVPEPPKSSKIEFTSLPELPGSAPPPNKTAPSGQQTSPVPATPPSGSRLSRRTVALLGAALVVLGGVVTAVILGGRSGSTSQTGSDGGSDSGEPAATLPDIHAGIEIGTTGIKPAVLTLTREKDGFRVTDLQGLKSINVSVAANVQKTGTYSEQLIKEATDAIEKIVQQLQEKYHVPREHIYIIGGSSLPPASNRDALAHAVEQRIGRPMRFLDQTEDTEYLIQGAIPQRHRASALFVDVGSGSVKCGYWEEGARFSVLTAKVPGAKAFAANVKKSQARGVAFARLVGAQAEKAIVDPLANEVEYRPGFRNRDCIYLGGGTAWILTTLLHPEACQEYYVPLTVDDFDRFHAQLLSKANVIPTADLSKIPDERVRKLAEAEVRAARDLLTYEQLLAGTEILRAVDRAFHLRGKEIYFSRVALYGWIMAYVERNAAGRPRDKP